MKKRITTILTTILAIMMFSFVACMPGAVLPSNPYGAGDGDITVMGARKVGVYFWRADNLNDIDGLKIWHQWHYASFGSWIDFTIIWVSDFNAFEEFLYRRSYEEQREWYKAHGSGTSDSLLDIYNADFFENNNLVLITMVEGVLTTGMRVDRVNENGIIDITRTRFNDYEWLDEGIGLSISIIVSNDFTPTTISINMRTNRVRR
ncbi:MAG: hypothetical protein FWE13_04210 [Firmicutes bacterium]|nr:hypothetical protein [Bacillota bacterium]